MLYNVLLGQNVQLTTKQAAAEGMSKILPYLGKYTARSLPAHPCELLIDNVGTKISVIRDFFINCRWAAFNSIVQINAQYKYGPDCW